MAAVAKFVVEIKPAGASLTVLKTTTGTAQSVAVAIHNSTEVRYFTPEELEVKRQAALPPDRGAAKQRRSLP